MSRKLTRLKIQKLLAKLKKFGVEVMPAEKLFIVLSVFYGRVIAGARTRARAYYLGERHQSPHPTVGYLDADITAVVEGIVDELEQKDTESFTALSASIRYIRTSLTMPTPERRWDKEARLKAEAEAAEEAAETEAEG